MKDIELTLLCNVGDPSIRSDSQLLKDAIICQGVHKDLVHQMVEDSRKEAHFDNYITDFVLRARAPMDAFQRACFTLQY